MLYFPFDLNTSSALIKGMISVRTALSFSCQLFCLAAAISFPASLDAAQLKATHVILVTTDGLRWQEVFQGAEERLMNKTNGGVKDVDALNKRFWRPTPEERRAALFPFLWGTVAKQGQLFGNSNRGSVVRVTNGRNFSYPGYSEFLTGAPDSNIVSNAKIPNPNTNVFEWLNTRPRFQARVSAIVNWDTIAWVLNAGRSRIPVWTGLLLPKDAPSPPAIPAWIETAQAGVTPIWGDVILDGFTSEAALQHMRSARPLAAYFAFGETDEWAHEGRYDLYLASAHNVDRFLGRLWEQLQSSAEYRDRTALVITTDHGRGSGLSSWRDHGAKIEESASIWVGVIGPDTPALGERGLMPELTQGQVASTVAALVGEDFVKASPRSALPIADVLGR